MSLPQTEKDKLIIWIEKHLGGTVERCESQGRWRPAWYVDLRLDGKLVPLYVRGDRNEAFPPWPLEYEAEVLQVLEREGIPAPHVYGMCSDPRAIIMSLAAGRNNLGTAQTEEERISVLTHLAEIMAAMHRLDIAPFTKAGMWLPQTPEDIALNYYRECEAIYLKGKSRPDPRIEFVRRWIGRNVPQRAISPRLAHMDAGQFVFENGRITAMLDFELACLSDPLIDLAALRLRALAESMGDLRPLFDRYRSLTGVQIDRATLGFHSIAWMIAVNLVIAPALATPNAATDYVEYLNWYLNSLLGALRDIAELSGVELEAPDLSASNPSQWAPALEILSSRLSGQGPCGVIIPDDYERSCANRLAEFAQRMDTFGAGYDADYLRDTEAVLGRRLRDWREADRELEAFVVEAGSEHDSALVTLFYRWTCRQAALTRGRNFHPSLAQSPQPLHELVD